MLFKARNIKTNLFDSKGISADFKNNVKMTSKPSLVGIAQYNCNTVFQRVQMNDYHCYCTLLLDVRKKSHY